MIPNYHVWLQVPDGFRLNTFFFRWAEKPPHACTHYSKGGGIASGCAPCEASSQPQERHKHQDEGKLEDLDAEVEGSKVHKPAAARLYVAHGFCQRASKAKTMHEAESKGERRAMPVVPEQIG